MFGRKRKKEAEGVGLAGLGTGVASPSMDATPTVSVTANPVNPATSENGATGAIPGFAPGTVPTNAAAVLGQILSGHGPVAELVAQIKVDPEGFRQRVMAQAQAAGVSTVMMSPQWISPVGGGTSQPAHVDVVDELTKAADLHHRGALTDAEFEALKKKLLGE